MPDIFDRVEPEAESKGDIFDRVEPTKEKSTAVGRFAKDVVEGSANLATGVGHGLMSSGIGFLDMMVPDALEPKGPGGRPITSELRSKLIQKPEGGSLAYDVGFGGEQMAEAMVPVPLLPAKLRAIQAGRKFLPKFGLSLAEGAVQGGGIGMVQSGGDIGKSAEIGAAGAVGSGVGQVARSAGAGVWNWAAGHTSDIDKARRVAFEFGRRMGITVDPATRTGSPFLQNVKRFLASGPEASTARVLADQQGKEFRQVGQELIDNMTGGTSTDKLTPNVVGTNVMQRTQDLIRDYSELASSYYDGVRAALKVSGQQVNVDRGQVKAALQPIYDKWKDKVEASSSPSFQYLKKLFETGGVKTTGQPASTTVTQTLKSVTPAPKGSATPVSTNIGSTTQRGPVTVSSSGTQQMSQGGFTSTTKTVSKADTTKAIPSAPPEMVDLDTAIVDMSYLGGMVRKGDPVAVDLNTGLASKVLSEYRSVVDKAVAAVDPNLLSELNRGRVMTTRKYDTLALTKLLGSKTDRNKKIIYSGTSVVDTLTRKRDAGVEILRRVAATDPSELPRIGASMVQEMLDKSGSKGAVPSYTGGKEMLEKWNSVGDETKRLLFGVNHTRELNDFFRLGSYLSENPVPTTTGPVWGFALRFMGMFTRPLTIVSESGMEVSLGRYMFGPNGPLKYMKTYSTGAVNYPASILAGLYRNMTGIDPADIIAEDQSMKP